MKDILCYAAKAAGEGMLFVFEAEERGRAFIHGYDLYEKDVSSWRIKQRIAQMEKQRYITTKKQSDGSITVYITKHGMERALTFKLDSLSLRKPTHWDKKWRIVIFDIPEESKQIRDIFRKRLRQLNLYQLQKSVYVSPYQCFDEIEFLRELYGVPMRVRYILAERIEDDRMLLQYFGLSD
ncbi:hypothetical protein M1555_01670 [Patescibacteria group bacterium]|nr:hypothetical protein [Patescibacteria group bacterium]